MAWRRRVMWAVFFAGVFAVLLRWHGLRIGGPHQLLSQTAALTPALERKVDRLATARNVDSARKAIDLALEVTSQCLRYGRDHRPTDRFDLGEREANDAEYTQLFTAIFNRIADGRELGARARPVRSAAPRVFGFKLPHPAFAHHDWVMVQPPKGTAAESWFVDPTLHDALMGWGIEGNVTGLVPVDGPGDLGDTGFDEQDAPVYDDPDADLDEPSAQPPDEVPRASKISRQKKD
ncbi:MAG: hypothetical protein R3B89_08460 [Polyangiaceae bacterium]